MLKTSGHQVQSYESGLELLKNAGQLDEGCILLDIRMPGMDGLETIDALRARVPGLPIVVVSGSLHSGTSTNLMRIASELPGVTGLAKPFKLSDLLRAVRAALAANQDRSAPKPAA